MDLHKSLFSWFVLIPTFELSPQEDSSASLFCCLSPVGEDIFVLFDISPVTVIVLYLSSGFIELFYIYFLLNAVEMF